MVKKTPKEKSKHYSLFQLPIFPFLLVKDVYINFKRRNFKNAIGLGIITSILIILWLGGYFLVGIMAKHIVKQFSLKENHLPQTATPIPVLSQIPTPKPKTLDGGKLFNLVNDYRNQNGFSTLLWRHSLCEYSKIRSQEIVTDWSHEGFQDDSKNNELFKFCPECVTLGENLAEGYHSEKDILNAWIASPSHKENLDGNWQWGCAIFYSNNQVSFIFGK
jgi:hypothetical protein